jgi:hypothetical protein
MILQAVVIEGPFQGTFYLRRHNLSAHQLKILWTILYDSFALYLLLWLKIHVLSMSRQHFLNKRWRLKITYFKKLSCIVWQSYNQNIHTSTDCNTDSRIKDLLWIIFCEKEIKKRKMTSCHIHVIFVLFFLSLFYYSLIQNYF